MGNRFKVIPADEFAKLGPRIGSREYKLAIEAEERAKAERLARQQRQIDEWQARKAQMTEREILMDEIAMLKEMKRYLENPDPQVEAEWQKLMNGDEK